jgi:hypothetical protein
MIPFDATITLNDQHLEWSGLSAAAAVAAVRQAVERMDGAGWIDVEAQSYPASLPGWVGLHPPASFAAPDTSDWQDLRKSIETIATAALKGIDTSF